MIEILLLLLALCVVVLEFYTIHVLKNYIKEQRDERL